MGTTLPGSVVPVTGGARSTSRPISGRSTKPVASRTALQGCTRELAQKVPCCRNTVAKLMRRAEILPRAIRRFRGTTDSRQTKASPN